MKVAGAITPSLIGDATVIAEKVEAYKQAEDDCFVAPTRTKNLNMLHFNVRTLNDAVKMEETATQAS